MRVYGACRRALSLQTNACWAEALVAQEEEDEGDEYEEEVERRLPTPVSYGLKGLVVAGTLYSLAGLYEGPKVVQETRRGEEAEGARVQSLLPPSVIRSAVISGVHRCCVLLPIDKERWRAAGPGCDSRVCWQRSKRRRCPSRHIAHSARRSETKI